MTIAVDVAGSFGSSAHAIGRHKSFKNKRYVSRAAYLNIPEGI
jgi:hypothetical protein